MGKGACRLQPGFECSIWGVSILTKGSPGKNLDSSRLLRREVQPYSTGLITIKFGSLELKIHSISSIKGTLFTFFFWIMLCSKGSHLSPSLAFISGVYSLSSEAYSGIF